MQLRIYNEFPHDLEKEWNDLLGRTAHHVPFLRHEYLKTWWQTRGGGEWSNGSQVKIISTWQDEQLMGIAPLFINEERLLLLGSIEVSDYLDLIARPEDMPAFVDALLPYMAENVDGWKTLDLYNVLQDSPSLPALESTAKKLGWSYELENYQPSPHIPLPDGWETYLAGIDKKQRHEIRRKLRRAENAEVPVDWYIVNDGSTLDAEMDDLFALMRYDEQKVAFLTSEMQDFMRQTAQCAFEAGCLQLSFLTIGGKKAAGYFAFDYLNRIWLYNSGMSLDFREYSAGWVALAKLIQWCIANGRTELDFMRGDENYKYRFGGINRHVMWARVIRS